MAKHFKYDTNQNIRDLKLELTEIGKTGLNLMKYLKDDASVNSVTITGNINDPIDVKTITQALSEDLKNTIFSLNLVNYIQCDAVKYVADILKDTCLTKLNITDNNIGDEEMQYLAGGLKNTSILSLNVAGNNIGSIGIKYLADILKDSCMTLLDIGSNCIRDEGMQYLADGLKNTSILALDVSDNNIGSKGIKYLADILKDTCMTFLDIRMNKMGDEGIIYLAGGLKSTSIVSLDVAVNNIGSIGIKYFADILKDTCITFLDISHNLIGDEGMQYLAGGLKNTSILSLNVAGNRIRSIGSKYLADILKDTCLTSLDISSNDIGDKGMQYLAGGLKNTSIISLDVSANNIGSIGSKYLADILKDTCITSLDIRSNNMSNEGMQYLVKQLEDTCIISLQPYNIINDKNQSISKNKILAKKMQDSFQNLVAQNTQNNDLEFIIPIDIPINMKQYLYIIKIIKDIPNVKAHIISLVCAIGVSKFPNIIQKINEFVSNNVSGKFIAFMENNLLDLQNVLGDDYNYVHLVKQCDDMQCADDIVQYLLLHRQLYYVDDDQEILHPYIYKMLHKHNMPLFNEQINPNKREEIISHFQNNPETDDTREIIDILLKYYTT